MRTKNRSLYLVFLSLIVIITSILASSGSETIETSSDLAYKNEFTIIHNQYNFEQQGLDISIEKPKESTVYFMGNELFEWAFFSLIIGAIEIEINASVPESCKVDHIDLFINNQFKTSFESKHNVWKWRETGLGKYKIRVEACDTVGNFDKEEITVIKIF